MLGVVARDLTSFHEPMLGPLLDPQEQLLLSPPMVHDPGTGPAGAAYHVIKPVVEFLAHPLDEVTGDPDQLRAKAQAWRTAATKLGDMAISEEIARGKLLGSWEGPAAQEAQDLVEQIVRELIATNAVIKRAIVQPTLGGPIKKVTGADKGIEWPQVL
jgi:hypothetical protein